MADAALKPGNLMAFTPVKAALHHGSVYRYLCGRMDMRPYNGDQLLQCALPCCKYATVLIAVSSAFVTHQSYRPTRDSLSHTGSHIHNPHKPRPHPQLHPTCHLQFSHG